MDTLTKIMGVGSCEVCQLEDFKYKCPRCLKKTCCLECTKKHKTQDHCSGTAYNPATYIASETLKDADTPDETNKLVQRDYNFLIGMNRQLELLKRDGKTKNKRALVTQHVPQHLKRSHTEQTPYVIRRGVHCLLLPKGMQKSLQNKSKWDKPLDQFVWTIEWCLLGPQGSTNFSHISHRNKEEDTLIDCIGKIVYEKCCEKYGVKHDAEDSNKQKRSEVLLSSGVRFYTKWFPPATQTPIDSKRLIALDPAMKVGECFRNKTVIEFPTVFLAMNHEPIGSDFSIVDQNGLIIHPSNGDTSRTDSSESSSESSPSSSEESSDDSSSDDDEAPPEEPSKKISTNDEEDEEDDYTPGISLDFLAD